MKSWYSNHCLKCQRLTPMLLGADNPDADRHCWCWDCWRIVKKELEDRINIPPGCILPGCYAHVPSFNRHSKGRHTHLVSCREAEETFVNENQDWRRV